MLSPARRAPFSLDDAARRDAPRAATCCRRYYGAALIRRHYADVDDAGVDADAFAAR